MSVDHVVLGLLCPTDQPLCSFVARAATGSSGVCRSSLAQQRLELFFFFCSAPSATSSAAWRVERHQPLDLPAAQGRQRSGSNLPSTFCQELASSRLRLPDSITASLVPASSSPWPISILPWRPASSPASISQLKQLVSLSPFNETSQASFAVHLCHRLRRGCRCRHPPLHRSSASVAGRTHGRHNRTCVVQIWSRYQRISGGTKCP